MNGICHNCGQPWNPDQKNTVCPVCHHKQKKGKETAVQNAFRIILHKYGTDIFSDSKRLSAVLSDLLPGQNGSRWLASVVSRSGAYEALCHASEEEIPYVLHNYLMILSRTYSLDVNKAAMGLSWVCNAMDLNVPQDWAKKDATGQVRDQGTPVRIKRNKGLSRKAAIFLVPLYLVLVLMGLFLLKNEYIPAVADTGSEEVAVQDMERKELLPSNDKRQHEENVVDEDSAFVVPVASTDQKENSSQLQIRERNEGSVDNTESSATQPVVEQDTIKEDGSAKRPGTVHEALFPVCHWDFSRSLSEQNGQEQEVHGNVQLVNIGGVNAAWFGGYGDYISCGQGFQLYDDYTFNILINSTNVKKDYASFFAKYETSKQGPYAYAIRQGHINLWINETPDDEVEFESIQMIEPHVWTTVTIVKEGHTFRIYLNGILDSARTVKSVMKNDDTVTIGCQALMFGDHTQLFFEGFIKDIRIYDQALSDGQVQELSDSLFENLYS